MLEFSGHASKILVWSLQLWNKMWGIELALGGKFPALKKTFGCVANGIYPIECLEVESSWLLYLLTMFGCSLFSCIAFAWDFPML